MNGGSLRARSLTALVVVALLAFAELIFVASQNAAERRVGAVIAVATGQRVATERIARLARDGAIVPMRASVGRGERELADLLRADSALNPPGWPPQRARDVFASGAPPLVQRLTRFYTEARAVADDPASERSRAAATLERESDELAVGLEALAAAYVEADADRSRANDSLEIGAFAATLAALVALFVFVLRPGEREAAQERASLARDIAGLSAVVVGAREILATFDERIQVARFLESAKSVLDAEPIAIDDPSVPTYVADGARSIGAFASRERAIVRSALQAEGPVTDPGNTLVALSVEMGSDDRHLLIAAERKRPFDVGAVSSLELLGRNFTLTARNARLYESVSELNKLKGDLIAMLAHDFKGPLTSIIGFAELARESEDTFAREAADHIARSAWRLSQLASDTLTMALLELGEISLLTNDIDLGDLARTVIASLDGAERIRLVIESEPVIVKIDEPRMRQVLENLIGNAVKYSPAGGEVVVTIHDAGERVSLAVADSGIGIPAADLDHVFDRFTRAANAKSSGISGTGFGLYITRMLVELHGGTISVSSVEGQGSTFTLLLRRTDPSLGSRETRATTRA